MLKKLGSLGGATIVGLGLVVAVTEPTTVPMSHTAGLQLTTTVLAMGGLGYETMDTDLMARVLGGKYANEEKLVGLPWPGEMAPWNGTLTLEQSVAVGLENMDAAIRDTPGPKIVAGASGTTLVVDEEMRRLADDPNAPPADELSFVVLGDANRGVFKQLRGLTIPFLDYKVPGLPVTKYDVLVVAGEYDGIGDWPDRPWNLLAVVNALAGSGLLQQIVPQDIVDKLGLEGFGSVHYDAMFADLTQVPKKNISTTVNAAGGVTTTYLVPTNDLPILRPLKTLGVAQDIIDPLEKMLRPIVDSAYVRNDPWNQPPTWLPSAVAKPTAVTRPAVARSAAATSDTAAPHTSDTPKKTSGKAGKRPAANSRSGA